MKLPRDLSGEDVVKGLRRVGYEASRHKGDHVYMTTHREGEHHVSIPLHKHLKVGTLAAILDTVCSHLGIDRATLLREMKS